MGFGGAVLTGCELEQSFHSQTGRTATLAHIAVEHATRLAAAVIPAKAVPAKQVKQSSIVLMSLAGFTGLLTLLLPEMMQTQWNRFLHPYGDIPRFSNTTIEIEEPHKRVMYGEPLDIRAAVRGEPVDSATLVLEYDSGNIETLPMFPEADSHWRASLAKMTEDAIYYVRTDHARSTRHSIEVIMVPRIENVRFRITPPAYTHRTAYEGPLSQEGISGLPGTTVEVRATSNRPLSRGEIAVTTSHDNVVTTVPMLPTASGSTEVVGEFTITGNGKFELQLFDIDENGSRDRFTGGITLLRDERPIIRISRPPVRSLATPSVTLPITIDAEDDYGIAEIRIFRSLNDSRFLATSHPLPDTPLRRFHGQVDLPLAAYNLQPGDSIKVFARVEDNDPDGAKGAESSVILIDIISQEQFEQMVRARNGMEMMLSRYREALRRLEAAKEELERLQEKLETLDPNDPASDETRRELQKLADRLNKEAEAIRKLAQNPLPYDLDRQLSEELNKAAKLAEDTADALEKMLESDPLNNESVKEQLSELGEKLASGKQSFDQAAMPSLELLAAVMPLKRAENRFVQQVMQQKDLAERLSSLKDREEETDPVVRARMRELEAEQREIRESLYTLLREIKEQADMLPEQAEFEELRKSAMEFADAVNTSGASTAMTMAQSWLAEYSGAKGYANALEAAEILEQFLSQCEGMGECVSQCLFGFSPSLNLNQTLDQLLRDMGFGGAGGSGMMGAGQGIGAQRGGPNVGLYGMLPGMSAFSDSQSEGRGGAAMFGGGGADGGINPDMGSDYDLSVEGAVGGSSGGAVPLRYRQAVGRYFQRIVEEGER